MLRRKKGDDLSVDEQGLQRLGDDKLHEFEELKREHQRKRDISQALKLDIAAREREASLAEQDLDQARARIEMLKD